MFSFQRVALEEAAVVAVAAAVADERHPQLPGFLCAASGGRRSSRPSQARREQQTFGGCQCDDDDN